ncbi:MAG: Gfo/Idh/MocA family oxidoreductase [Methanophagales archaeon]|nr:Gfo/Idh/MocA family oxidoreductase [Methanophagales archaeon]
MRVAIVGNGNIYNLAHVYAWQSLKDAEIQATCDIIPERAEKACRGAAAKHYYTNMDDLLSNADIDVIDLCVPTYEHARLSIAALKAGKHVICEKPMARSVESAAEMLKAAEKSGKGLYIGHTRRFDQRWKRIKEGIDSGRIGMPLYIRRCERSWLPFPSNSWYWDFAKSGGVLLDIGIHCVDLVNWFFGSKPSEVFACGKMIRDEAQAKGVHDLATVMLRYEDGKTAFIDVSWAFPKTSAPFYSSLDIIGTGGRIEYSDKNANPMVFAGDRIEFPRYSPLLSASLEAFSDEIREFVACVDSGREPAVTAHDAYDALKIISAAEESVKKGEVIRC